MKKKPELPKTISNSVYIVHPSYYHEKLELGRSSQSCLEEAIGLAHAIDLDVIETRIVSLRKVFSHQFLGSGVVEELAARLKELEVGLLFFNHDLTPIQQRNLEKSLDVKVIDRTGLILEIFGARARTNEGKLQVQLAALVYQRSRLVRSWTHLERQRGGGGFMGGPGETQIEADRRLIDAQIHKIKLQLKQVAKTRTLHRTSRSKVPYPIVALIGYTNAGKSTLFNRLSGADVFAKDLLFATLDPTMRLITLNSGQKIILSDTVGFISQLPTDLIAAFKSTLEEVQEADVILHVRDISHPETEAQKNDVANVLHDLGIDLESDARVIEVCNKVDLLTDPIPNTKVGISALTGQGMDQLILALDEMFNKDRVIIEVVIDVYDGAALAWLYQHGEILEQQDEEHKLYLKARLRPEDVGRFESYFGYNLI